MLGVLNAFPAVPEPGAKCCPAASGGVQYHVHIVLGAEVRGVRSRVPRKGVRWSIRGKSAAVMRLLRGRELDEPSRELRVEAHRVCGLAG